MTVLTKHSNINKYYVLVKEIYTVHATVLVHYPV